MRNFKWKMENLWLWFVVSHSLGGPRGVAHHEVESARCSFAEARVAVERNGNAYRGVLARKPKAAFEQAIVNLVNMERAAFLTQQQRNGLGNSSIHEAIAEGFRVWSES